MSRNRSKRQQKEPSPPPAPVVRPSRRKWMAPVGLALVAGVGVWVAWSLLGSSGLAERRPLNVIVVTGDTLRADRLGCYGSQRIITPNIDRLAASGVLFQNTTTVTPLTLPAHSSIFTGTYPMHHGVRDNGGYYLEPEQVTFAEILKEKGYATGAFVGAFVLDSRWGLDQGFDRYFDNFDLSKYEQVSLDSVQRRGDEVLTEALGWLETVHEQRFFSWIHFYDPHTPYDPPEPYRTQYGGVRWGLYDGEVAFLDSLVGQLLSWLDEKGLAESTIVVFMGDHGESLGEHKEIAHGFFIYGTTVDVPFILKAPYRTLQGRRVTAPVRTIDLVPTLLDLLGYEIPTAVQGRSLLDLASGQKTDARLVGYSESFYPRHHYGWSELKSIRSGNLHFIAAPRPELYDVEKDPTERVNLASDRPETVRDLERQLQEVLDQHSVEGIDEKAPDTLDPETRAQLAALGYLGGPSKVRIDPSAELADPKDKIELFNLIKEAGADSTEGRIDDALAKIHRLLDEDPGILEAYQILGNLYGKQGDRDKAIAAYQDALARDPEYVPALFSLAAAYDDMGRAEDAEAGYRRVLELDPRDNRALFMLAKLHAGKKEYTEALELLQRAVDLGVERAPTHNLMAECYIELDQLDEAEAAVQRALDKKEDLHTVYFNLALIREARGDLPGAIEAYQKELEMSPKDYKTHFNLAKVYGSVGRADRQKEHFKKSIELNERFPEGYLYLAKMYLDSGDLDEALRLALKGIELGPERSMAPLGHYILADVYNRMGRFREAEREVTNARKLEGL